MNDNKNLNSDNSSSINVYDNQYDNLKKTEIKIINDNDNDYDYDDGEINNLEWKEYHETILVDWADKAMCYRWLHNKSCNKYTFLRNLYTIPVIILSTLTGTANFAIDRVPSDYQGYCQIAIGSFNILAGIITTISQFLKINELSEAHRVSSISWDKFYRNIRVELIKCPDDRTNVTYLLKSCKDEYDRLIETSPIIDVSIINKFNTKFINNTKTNTIINKFINNTKPNTKMNTKPNTIMNTKTNTNTNTNTNNETMKSIHKPEILDSLESTKHIVYKSTQKDTLMAVIKNKKNTLEKENMIEDFIYTFEKEYNRKPSIIEIYDNLDNKISNQVLDKFFNSKKWLSKNTNTNTNTALITT